MENLDLVISIVSLITSFICSAATIVITFKVAQLNNTEALHKYEKKITKFELSFRDEAWFYSVIYSGEFSNYNEESQKLIFEWWQEYKKVHKPKKAKQTLPNSDRFNGTRLKLIADNRRNNSRGYPRFPDIKVATVEPVIVEENEED